MYATYLWSVCGHTSLGRQLDESRQNLLVAWPNPSRCLRGSKTTTKELLAATRYFDLSALSCDTGAMTQSSINTHDGDTKPVGLVSSLKSAHTNTQPKANTHGSQSEKEELTLEPRNGTLWCDGNPQSIPTGGRGCKSKSCCHRHSTSPPCTTRDISGTHAHPLS